MQSTELSRGSITRAHEIAVVLQERHDDPAVVLIEWPAQPTITTPHQLQATITKTMTILASASVKLSQIRRDRRL